MSKFEDYVKSLSPRGIVMLMIESLERPVTKIDMDTFGNIQTGKRGRVCYGCAATNAALRALEAAGMGKASKLKFEIDYDMADFAKAVEVSKAFLDQFEFAINSLRAGDIKGYNYHARRGGFAQLNPWPTSLPYLDTHNYKQNLKWYREFAMEQSDVR